ncbi:tannase and feruloyl esterase [Lophiostoma macrostomum CBS 122681]|uniref:Carboxylic ester hydrolase n=1 Tax=Lophiostoma macrostomum CBS 122681 TaxID=1314788 RepID=A0A6A6T286_9PLEO|nr:tannase and feruloyl esterase [Lophiostoma macrostomum CBS 122681]
MKSATMKFPIQLLATGSTACALSSSVRNDACTSLTSAYGANYTIVNTTLVQAGEFKLDGLDSTNSLTFCRVISKMPYGINSTINFEVWLPESTSYSGRYLSVGNGGFAGTIDYSSMLANLNTGFAVGGCDAGHPESENGPSKPGGYVPFLNSRAETLAWLRDSIAMFTVPARQLTTRFHQRAPKKMYYSGCSTGGAQGYALAQYHPDIFDGIFAGSAGNWYSHLILSFLWNGVQANKPGAFLDQAALNYTRDAVVKHCDKIDGMEDGVIDDPTKCDFSIDSLLCHDGQDPVSNNVTVCLNLTQIETVKAIYTGPGKDVYPGFAKGSESEWLVQEAELYEAYAVPILQNLVFKNLSYDYTTFDWERDVAVVDEVAGPLITAISPRLDAYKSKGGKLIATQGWADPYNAPFWPMDQHNEAKAIYGEKELNEFWRLFMVPGGGHCGPATSYPQVPGTWHALDALIPWVEKEAAPTYVLATNPADGSNTTRKLCPYPRHAVYEGGDNNHYIAYDCQ